MDKHKIAVEIAQRIGEGHVPGGEDISEHIQIAEKGLNDFAAQVARDTEAKYGGTAEEVKALVMAARKVRTAKCNQCLYYETRTECDQCYASGIVPSLAPWGVK